MYAIVLAAGAGSRMRSDRPKPLHRLCGKPMVRYVLDALSDVHPSQAIVVVGHEAEWVTKKIGEQSLEVPVAFAEQVEQRGTGDAAMTAVASLPDAADDADIVIMPGDTPLLRPETIARFVEQHRERDVAATVLSMVVDDPAGYGRVVRDAGGRVTRIVEHGDATDEELAIDEVNSSIYCVKGSLLAPALRRLDPDNAQGEYYLTDVIEVLAQAGHPVDSMAVSSPIEAAGVNDRAQLAVAEAELRRRTNDSLLASGVTLVDPAATYVDTTVEVGRDVTLFPGVILSGATIIGDRTEIGPNCRLTDCIVGSDVQMESTVGTRATVGSGSSVGPFAALAPESEVPADTVCGPFYNSAGT